MKTIIALLTLTTSLLSFAQDRYYDENPESCETGKSCLIHLNYSSSTSWIDVEVDAEGNTEKQLSSRGNLSDTVYQTARLCYINKPQEICEMLDLMVSSELEQGGTSYVTKYKCEINPKKEIIVSYKVDYDMRGTPDSILNKIRPCQQEEISFLR